MNMKRVERKWGVPGGARMGGPRRPTRRKDSQLDFSAWSLSLWDPIPNKVWFADVKAAFFPQESVNPSVGCSIEVQPSEQ